MYRLFAKRFYVAPRPPIRQNSTHSVTLSLITKQISLTPYPFIPQPLRGRQFLPGTGIHIDTRGTHNSSKVEQNSRASAGTNDQPNQTPGNNDGAVCYTTS